MEDKRLESIGRLLEVLDELRENIAKLAIAVYTDRTQDGSDTFKHHTYSSCDCHRNGSCLYFDHLCGCAYSGSHHRLRCFRPDNRHFG